MESTYLFVFISLGLAVVMFVLASKLSKLKANIIFMGLFAVIIGLLIGSLAYLPLRSLPGIYGLYLPIVFYVISVGTSLWLFMSKKSSIESWLESVGKIFEAIIHLRTQLLPKPTLKHKETGAKVLVDTSVLIDGRIVDIAKTGFVPGQLIITRFVLSELQNIADSDDSARRAKGRRGLDSVNELKSILKGKIKTSSEDVEDQKEVDLKLVHLAKRIGASVLTNDFNLNKVAKAEDVAVLNINELSQALRPIIIPGEEMDLKIVQAGKEKNQGVGYLPDGTMIVLEAGDKHIGETVKVEIKRVLQTAAGKMYFAILRNGNSK